MSQQGLKQQSVRDITGTILTYEGDWHALFDMNSIPSGTFNERLLAYMNGALEAAHTNINDALAAAAAIAGASNWSSVGDLSGVLTTLDVTLADITFDVDDQPYSATGAFSVDDTADDGTGVYELTPAVSDGNFTVAGGPAFTGLTFTLGDGTQDSIMTFEGLLDDLNTALATVIFNGMSQGTITFTIPFSASTGGTTVARIATITVTNVSVDYAGYYASSDATENYAYYITDSVPHYANYGAP